MIRRLTSIGQTRARRRDLMGQLSAPMRSYLSTESGGAGLLLLATVLALLWANSPWSGSYHDLWSTDLAVQLGSWSVDMHLDHWVNDGLMVLFFFVIGLEVRREISVGELTNPRRAVVPLLAGLGGMVVPAVLFLLLAPGGEAARGWGAVIGTDTAFMLGALAVVGPTFATQLRIFLLTLTVIDDIVAVTVIGVVYSDELRLVPLVVAALCLLGIQMLSRAQSWRASGFVALLVVLWLAVLDSGLHASIAGMAAGLLVAARAPQRSDVEGAASLFRAFRQSPMPGVGSDAKRGLQRAISVNERLQTALHPWTSYLIVPLFAFANAGVDLRGGVLGQALGSRLTWGIVAGLVLGKLLGIGIGALLAVRAGLGALPRGVLSGHVFGGAALSGIGFTVSLLIIHLAFDSELLQDEATVGVLIAAVLATAVAAVIFRLVAWKTGQDDADLPRFLADAVDEDVDHIRGLVDAPLTLVEYGDFECPFCAKATGAARELRTLLGDRLRYVFRHLPLPDVHPHAELAARGAEAAARQGKFWEMHDTLFVHQDQLEWEDLAGYAAKLELDTERFLRDLDDAGIDRRIQRDVAGAEASGARGTPTFFIGGLRHVGPHDAQSLLAALEESQRRAVRSAANGPE